MFRLSWQKFFVLTGLITLVWACSKDHNNDNPTPNNPNQPDRQALLINTADNIILPAYANFKTKLDQLTLKSNSFTSNPTNATLLEFRQAWVDAYVEWQKVELFDVGPAEVSAFRLFMNIYPANAQGIESNIVSGNANLELPASYPQQGFPALDYLINGLGATDADILAKYTTAADSAQRIAYLQKVITQMNSKFTRVHNEWTSGYRDTFVASTGINASSSTSMMINGYVMNYERYIRSGKFGIPSGAMVDGESDETKVEAYYKSDISLLLAKTAHQASVDFFNGKSVKDGAEGYSIKNYLNTLDAKDSKTGNALSETINSQFSAISNKLNTLNQDLRKAIQLNNQDMLDVYGEMQKVVRLLKVDMTSAMSITITYTDNDGD